jgi:clostripain
VQSIGDTGFARMVVEAFREYHENNQNYWGDTLAAVDLSKTPSLKTNIDALGAAIYNDSHQAGFEAVRDSTLNFYHNTEGASVDVPYYDINDLCGRIINDTTNGFGSPVKTAAQNVINSLADAVVTAYGGAGNWQQAYYYGDGSIVKRGLSLFFSRGNKTYTANSSHELNVASGTPKSHFWFQWWYTTTNVNTWWTGGGGAHYYGHLDFCDSDLDGTVETWRELMKAWYDPVTDVNTPGGY